MQEGIIVGSDQHEEDLLPFWYKCYSQYMTYPVCFMDFGMSKEMVDWCKARGQYLAIKEDTVALANATEPPKRVLDELCGKDRKDIHEIRKVWLKKPFACLHSPFIKTIWVDVDCVIRNTLAPIFAKLGLSAEIALVRELTIVQNQAKAAGLIVEGEILYNSGVIGFIQKSPIIQEWVNIVKDTHYYFPGDQDALSKVIFLKKFSVIELSPIFNWSWVLPKMNEAIVVHFNGAKGKELLRNFIKRTTSH